MSWATAPYISPWVVVGSGHEFLVPGYVVGDQFWGSIIPSRECFPSVNPPPQEKSEQWTSTELCPNIFRPPQGAQNEVLITEPECIKKMSPQIHSLQRKGGKTRFKPCNKPFFVHVLYLKLHSLRDIWDNSPTCNGGASKEKLYKKTPPNCMRKGRKPRKYQRNTNSHKFSKIGGRLEATRGRRRSRGIRRSAHESMWCYGDRQVRNQARASQSWGQVFGAWGIRDGIRLFLEELYNSTPLKTKKNRKKWFGSLVRKTGTKKKAWGSFSSYDDTIRGGRQRVSRRKIW